jgi:hypothetical protein
MQQLAGCKALQRARVALEIPSVAAKTEVLKRTFTRITTIIT